MFGFGISLGPIVWLYIPEILPSQKGVSLASLHLFFWASIVGLVFPTIVDGIGLNGAFMMFTGLNCLSLLFIIVFIKETKGKTIQEID